MENKFILSRRGMIAPVVVEESAYLGVKKIARKVVCDLETVTGTLPELLSAPEAASEKSWDEIIIFATVGRSELLEEFFRQGLADPDKLRGQREVFEVKLLDQPFQGIKQALLIYGSDKRGTIYGMFHLSELIGISPLIYWGDVKPCKRKEITFGKEIEMCSKVPSVKYRGFFINDEWPCFGNWSREHFGGFTVTMYDKVFELLLRLKGNYLWPAMWTSSFALDGPGIASAELADCYGVIMGNSHHEPCLRASEEWDIYRGPDSQYGNDWNYYKNSEGLLKYWEDGLKRSGGFESLITIGMRGERDSSMLGEGADLKQNIDLLKDIIKNQLSLIQKHVVNADKVPKLLALYKEVEAYFYGDETTPGLKDWQELEGVTLMLCEDNFGNMRTLPTQEMRSHRGGYGMYYHFDYHGDPISYEWVNSTPLSKIWEQMTMAYEYGVKDVWIVNVGDLKFNEFPLQYFMELAYDFEGLGTASPNKTGQYTLDWIERQFGSRLDAGQKTAMAEILSGYIRLNACCRPETLNSHTYHPVNYSESDRILCKAENIEQMAESLYESIFPECRAAYYSMIYFPAMASMNLLKMHLYAGKNEHYAKQGKTIANEYAEKVKACIERDRELAKDFGTALNGKWNGMQLAPHIGFTKWNEDNSRYPIRMLVEPAYKPRMTVSKADSERIAVKDYFAPMIIEVKDFMYPPYTDVMIEVANDGTGTLNYTVQMEACDWLKLDGYSGQVEKQERLSLQCIREKLPIETHQCIVTLSDGDTTVLLHVYGRAVNTKGVDPLVFFENMGSTVIEVCHYSELKNTKDAELIVLEDFGRGGYGIKAFPVTKCFEPGMGPCAVYSVFTQEAGEYVLETLMSPSNPIVTGGGMRYSVRAGQDSLQVIDSIPEGFKAGVPHNPGWTEGVLNNMRVSKCLIRLQKGINRVEIGMVDPGFVPERLILYKSTFTLKESRLGPPESYFTPVI